MRVLLSIVRVLLSIVRVLLSKGCGWLLILSAHYDSAFNLSRASKCAFVGCNKILSFVSSFIIKKPSFSSSWRSDSILATASLLAFRWALSDAWTASGSGR